MYFDNDISLKTLIGPILLGPTQNSSNLNYEMFKPFLLFSHAIYECACNSQILIYLRVVRVDKFSFFG